MIFYEILSKHSLSIITFNINRLNAPIQRQGVRMVKEKKKKKDPSICCLQKTHFRLKNTCKLKGRGWRNIYHVNGFQKKDEVTIFISDKLDYFLNSINMQYIISEVEFSDLSVAYNSQGSLHHLPSLMPITQLPHPPTPNTLPSKHFSVCFLWLRISFGLSPSLIQSCLIEKS